MSLPARWRLTVWYMAVLAAVLAVLGTFLLVRLRADLLAEVDRSLRVAVADLQLHLDPDDPGDLAGASATLRSAPGGGLAAQLLAPDGRVLRSIGAANPARPLMDPATLREQLAAGHPVDATERLAPGGPRLRVFAAPLAGGRPGTVVVAASSLAGVDGSLDRLRLLLLVAGPIGLILAGLGGMLVARVALRPVARMTEQAAAISSSRLHERVAVPSARDELYRLATTLNAMLARIEHGVDEQRRLAADASHELRTPLAVMRSELEVGLREADLPPAAGEVLASVQEEVERMTRLVDGLLVLARGDEGGLTVLQAPLPLDHLVRDVADRLRPVAVAKDVTLDLTVEPVQVTGDRQLLDEVATNLLNNALKYTQAGGRVALRLGAHDGHARLTVADSGPGIPPEDLSRVFDRFYRVDTARSRAQGGVGLGLAICRELVEAHGGRIWAEPGPAGGSSFIVDLPLRDGGDGAG